MEDQEKTGEVVMMESVKKKKNPLVIVFLSILGVIILFLALVGIMALGIAGKFLGYPLEMASVQKTYEAITQIYYEPVETGTLIEGAAGGMVSSLNDPYSQYFTKEEFAAFMEHLSGSYSGTGTLLSQNQESGYVEIIKVFKGSPAEKAGVLPGDIIQSIDDELIDGKYLEEISSALRGEDGSTVKVKIYRPSEDKEYEFVITRAQIQTSTVEGTFLETDPDTIYISISSFTETTGAEFTELISGLEKKPKKIILDLRNNGGGLVQAAVDVSRYLTPGGVVVYAVGRDNVPQGVEVGNDRFLDIPMVVLVNENTASSSEILAGAIQDYETGTLLGTKTYGKAVVQSIIDMPTGGGMRLTTQRYLTPDKRDINKQGLVPEVEFTMTPEENALIDLTKTPDEKGDLFIQKALEILKNK